MRFARLGLQAATLIVASLFMSESLDAQTESELAERWVLDKYSVSVSGRFNSLDTKLRVDSEELGVGTEIDAEDIFGLDSEDTNWDIQGEIRLGRKHVLSAAYADFIRENSRRIDRDITIGDEEFPVNALVRAEYDIETIAVGYRFYPWIEETWALGFGVGLRSYDFAVDIEAGELELAESRSASGPMPFVGVDLRLALSPRFRAQGAAGFFDVELGDLGGSQILAEGSLEYLVLPYLTLGAGVDLGQLDVDIDGDDWNGAVETDIIGLRIFTKLRS